MPNSSASISVSTSAAQLTATNGPRLRGLRAWISLRDQLLACAALPFDENREVRSRDAADPRAQVLHDDTLPHQHQATSPVEIFNTGARFTTSGTAGCSLNPRRFASSVPG